MRPIAGRRQRPPGIPLPLLDNGALVATTRYKPILDFLGASAALAIPFVALRVLIVARFNFDVAVALAIGTDPVRLVVTALIPAMPLLLGVAAFACIFHGTRKATRSGNHKRRALLPWILAALVLLLPAILTWPAGEWMMLIFIPAMMTMVIAIGVAYDDPEHSEYGYTQLLRRIVPVFLGTVLATPALFAAMWLPPERISIKDHAELVYVLNTDDKEAVLFIPERTVVQRFKVDELSERQYCTAANLETVADALWGGPEGLPTCPN
jgi:hypothetical protein